MWLAISIRYIRFKYKYLHKFIDADGAYGYQCVDLIRRYVQEAFDYKWIPVDYAKNISSKNLTPDKRRELRVWIDDFKTGDIVTFGGGLMWHVGIIHTTNPNGFIYLDQNGRWGALNKDKNGNYVKLKGNGVELRWFNRGDKPILKCFRYINSNG